MHRSMKAITPIIAIIVLLLITVAISGAAWTYISGFWSGTVDKQIEVTDAFCAGTDQAKILVKNIGTESLNTGDIAILDKNSGNDLTDQMQWTSGVADSGLILELKFDEGSGTVAQDTSGGGNHGTLLDTNVGNADGNTPPQWINGKVGKALNFDGADDVVDVGNNYPLNSNFTDLTISFWMYADSANTDSGLVGKGTVFYGITYHTDGRVWCYIYGGGNHVEAPVATGAWHHVAGTLENGVGMKLYVDGNMIDSKAPSEPVYFGYTQTGGTLTAGRATTFFDGRIDEARLYNRALSVAEIKALADNAVALGPGEIGTVTHTCNGRCDYRILLGGVSRAVSVQC